MIECGSPRFDAYRSRDAPATSLPDQLTRRAMNLFPPATLS
jgi:hypothetical protein